MEARCSVTADAMTSRRVAVKTPGFADTVASEWTKLMSVRTTYILAGLAIVLSIGMTAVIAAAIGSTWDDLSPQEQADLNPILFGIFGSIFGAVLFAVLGVLAFASEYSSGMIRLTFTTTPQRGRVLLAKGVVVSIVVWVAGTIAAIGMFLVGQAVASGFDIPTASLGDADALRTVAAISLAGPVFPLIGLALAVLLRSTAGAITAIVAMIFAPSFFGGLLPRWWQENILAYNPSSANDALALGHVDDGPLYLDPPLAAVVVVFWVVAFMAAAYFVLNRRDA